MSDMRSGDEQAMRSATKRGWWHRRAGTTQSYEELALREVIGHLLRRTQQVHATLWSEHVPGGITSPQYAVLHVLARQPGVDQTRLGELASLDRSTTAGIVKRLLARGLIQRRRDAADARRYLLEITPPGRAVLNTATAPALEVDRRLLEGLTESQAQELVHLLNLILASAGRSVTDDGPHHAEETYRPHGSTD